MADNEDDSGSTRTITDADPPGAAAQPRDVAPALPGAHCAHHGANVSASARGQSVRPGNSAPVAGCGAPPADFLQSCPEEQSLLVGTELSLGPGLGPDLGPDLINTTTIIYVQPDGSLVEGSGLTPEEQQALLEQLTKQQVIQVSDTEAAHLLQQSPLVRTVPVHGPALDPNQLQQVINQVTRSQQQVHVPQQSQKQPQKPVQVVHTPQRTGTETGVLAVGPGQADGPVGSKTQNASQQLKSVAQQVAMQTGSSVHVVQKKTEPVRIQIQVPKQEVKPNPAPQQKTLAVSQPQVKLSANGSVSSAQVIHIQPVVGQQGQIFLQQSPGDPPIQLLLQSPAPVVGSLLPLVQKLTSSIPAPKVAASPLRLQIPTSIKTPPSVTAKPVPLLKTMANGAAPTSPSPVKPAAATAQATPSNTPVNTVATPPKDREKEKKAKKRERKAVKILTRSGRVSRPPKYKAKDYKFIKTEDLADSHQSDSDDYSDMSVEEEESGKKDGSSPSLTYSHKSRSFRCQSCDKAYIGPGGLNRHYKLNPTHGDPELPEDTEPQQLHDGQLQETTAAEADREEEEEAEKPVPTTTHKVEGGPAAAVGLRGLHHRGPGRPRGRGRGRGRGRSLGPPPRVAVGVAGRRGRRGRPPKLGFTVVTAEQQAERRRARLQEMVDQCEDEDLMDIVLPRLNKVLSLWELLLAKVERGVPTRTRFPDIYREFESLQTQVRQAAQEYILSPQGGAAPLEVRNIEVARCLGILDEVNRMKVLPGASPFSSLTNKNVRYMENSKMLPPSKRFKMENSVPVHQNGIETPRAAPPSIPSTPSSLSLKSCSVSVSPLASPSGSRLTPTDSVSSSSSPTLAPPPLTPIDGTPIQNQNQVNWPLQTSAQGGHLLEGQNQVLNTSDITAQMKELEKALDSSPENAGIPETGSTNAQGSGSSKTPEPGSITSPELENPMDKNPETSSTEKPESCSTQRPAHRDPVQSDTSSTGPCETKEVQEGQEIYIQTEGLTVQLAEPGSDRIVIVNGPDGTTMHIQTPEGVPLEAVQALLGIEASDGVRTPQ